MPKLYKLKLILGGAQNSGKSSFINFINRHQKAEPPIGVSFESVNCYANNGDLYKFLVWDLKDRERFRFLFPVFCRGAYTGLICFDLSDKNSFLDLNRWITLFRESAGEIPIILIGTKADLEKREVTDEEINDLIAREGLECAFFTSTYDNDEKKEEIFREIVQKIDLNNPLNHFYILQDSDDKKFKLIEKLFERCPICKKKNHSNRDLRNVYYNKHNPVTIRLRENLLRLINNLENINIEHSNKISIGIPCCACFKEFFGEQQV